MRLRRLAFTQTLPTTIPRAWDYFSDPHNLAAITPPDLGFRILGELPPQIYPGLIIEYSVSPFPPLRLRWVTEITHADGPRFFVDEQRFGPYRFWHHQHLFREIHEGVEMTDLVSYILPFGPLGLLAAPIVAARLARIFSFRRGTLANMTW